MSVCYDANHLNMVGAALVVARNEAAAEILTRKAPIAIGATTRVAPTVIRELERTIIPIITNYNPKN
ncbi:MAG: hypothetical protein ACHQIM_00090 [Sphingobacteriales bacterium]